MLDPNKRVSTSQLMREVAEKMFNTRVSDEDKAKIDRGEITRDEVIDHLVKNLEDGVNKTDIDNYLIPVLQDKYGLDLEPRTSIPTNDDAYKSGLSIFTSYMNTGESIIIIYEPKGSMLNHAIMVTGDSNGNVTYVDPASDIPSAQTMTVGDAYSLFTGGDKPPGIIIVPTNTPKFQYYGE
jgi:hypothetical protein